MVAKSCSVEGCDKGGYMTRGMCKMHYRRWLVSGDPGDAGYIRQPGGRPCKVEGCGKAGQVRRMCPMHYKRWVATGDPGAAESTRPTYTQRRVGHDRRVNKSGYAMIRRPGSVEADKRGWVFEHRAVMAEMVGRDLLAHETVHHINGVRDDNRPENLELWSSSQPAGQRVEDKLAWALEIVALYQPTYSLPR